MTPLHLMSITELAPLLASSRVRSVDVTRACLEVIADRNGELNAFVSVCGDIALAQAGAADADLAAGRYRGPLHGVPLSLKDLIDVAGMPTTAASRLRESAVATRDAVIVTRLRKAGAIIIGKCNLHEFAFGTTGEESAYGPTLNPADMTRSPGGSSSGSAVSVTTGMACASIGTDTGGSIRIPASACGCVGLKPTYAEFPCEGIVPLGRSLDHVGPLTRTVSDARIVHAALRGSVLAVAAAPPTPTSARSLRLGLPAPYFMDVLDDDVRRCFAAALDRLQSGGVQIREVRIGHAADAPAIYLHVQLPEASAYHAAALERHPQDYQPGVRLRLELGRYVLAEDYVRAQQGRALLRCEVDQALGGVHALVLPTLPIPAPILGARTARIGSREEPIRPLMLRETQLFNLTGHPAISLPGGATAAGLPCGLQLVGRINRTEGLLDVAECCERLLGT